MRITVYIKYDGVLQEQLEMDSGTWDKIYKIMNPILDDLEEFHRKKNKVNQPDRKFKSGRIQKWPQQNNDGLD